MLITLGLLLLLFASLALGWVRAGIGFPAVLILLVLSGNLTVEEALSGFSNEAFITVGALFVVASAARNVGALRWLEQALLVPPRSVRRSVARLTGPTMGLSALLNNTPIVAMLIPSVRAWTRAHEQAIQRYLLPLSAATILGGMVTLIGTSTNLVVSGLLAAQGYAPLSLFSVSAIGIPVALVGWVYIVWFGHTRLSGRVISRDDGSDLWKDATFELRVSAGGPFEHQTVAEAQLRNLGRAYLAHIRRGGQLLEVSPDTELLARDVLVFVGDAASLSPLLMRPGLERVVAAAGRSAAPAATLPLYEAIVAHSSSLVGKTLREVQFREAFGGVVLAIERQDQRLQGGIGRTPLRAGDSLMVEAAHGFDRLWSRRRNEFYLVARRAGDRTEPSWQAPWMLALLVVMFVAMATGWVPTVIAALSAALGALALKTLDAAEARSSLDMEVLVVIASALGIAVAVAGTGVSALMATALSTVGEAVHPLAALALLYIVTNTLTETVTNNAAAALMLPAAVRFAEQAGLPVVPLAVLVCIAASASFLTPYGYQTNLMVQTPGRYAFVDYLRFGWPLSLISLVLTTILTGYAVF